MIDDNIQDEPEAPANGESPTKGYIPAGWDTAEAFLAHVRKTFTADESYDRQNRDMALEDLEFIAGDQWDERTRKSRTEKGRPCLTINVLPQFIGQVIGDRRLNKTAVQVRPLRGGSQEIAQARSGLIKAIEMQSRAERVYDAACEDQVSCGIGHFRIDLDYAANDVFEQDIVVRHIPNPLAVLWDRMSVDPTGKDARHCWVIDSLPKDVYNKKYPQYPCPSTLGNDATGSISAGWYENDVVRITEFWEMIEKPANFAMMADGAVEDVTNKPREEYEARLWKDPASGKTLERASTRTYARMHLVSGDAILSQAYELPLTRLPIIKVEGRVVRVGDDRVRYGLVRYAKDAQRLKNYWRSVAAERLAMAPKAMYLASEDAIEGREDDWEKAHLEGDNVLVYNKGTEKPDAIPPADVPAALLQEAALNQQDIKDTTGLHDASLGVRSNEVSGRAIQARQKEGDVATAIYHDNVGQSILEGGDVMNQLIGLAYDTVRQLRIVGPNDKDKMIIVNDPTNPESINIVEGKYDVALVTGPSFTTQRQEAQDAMMALLQTAPQLMGVIGDLVVEAMDWPGAVDIAARIRKTLPPELLQEEESEQTPEQQAEAAQQAQQAQAMQMAQVQEAVQQLEHAAAMREQELLQAQAKTAQAAADADIANSNRQKAESEAAAAEANAVKAEVEAEFAPQLARQKIDLAERTASAKMAAPSDPRGAGRRPEGRQAKKGQGK